MTTWKKFFTRWRDAVSAARTVLAVRKRGVEEPLAIIPDDELRRERIWLASRDYENQLMQQCILSMTQGKAPCEWCEENAECTRMERYHHGCDGWWLRFLTEEEMTKCEQRAEEGGSEEAAETCQGDDEGAADDCAHEERYHAGGFEPFV